MRLKINFNNALALSLLWHLLCFFIVTIIIVPVGISHKKLSEVYFLGSLPDRRSRGYEFIKSAEGFSRRDRGFLGLNMSYDNNVIAERPPVFKEAVEALSGKKHYNFRNSSIAGTQSSARSIGTGGIYKDSFAAVPAVQIKSELRKIVFEPQPSDFALAWPEIQENNDLLPQYSMQALAFIGQDGIVKSVDIVRTSGIAGIDAIIKDYIAECRFESIQAGGTQELIVFIDISF